MSIHSPRIYYAIKYLSLILLHYSRIYYSYKFDSNNLQPR